ncbi:MAG TPA: AAA family ATPase [Candidatus Saccharimonadales bacterium]|nr:AAA family ATPase [Candidatus Saccharimonadales bacterium]
MPDIFVIGGPNGAGKSTTAREMLPAFLGCLEFVNADQIAQGLPAFRPESVAFSAGRAMLNRLNELARQRIDFAFETTLASRSFAPWLRRRRQDGFGVNLIYLWLLRPQLAVERVHRRVAAGGHDVPEKDIQRRYERGWRNFIELYMPLADNWEVYDNSGFDPHRIALGGREEPTTVLDAETWERIKQHIR